jgi:lysophospholipase L1-like esterase
VPAGFITPEIKYTAMLYAMLEEQGLADMYENMAVNGYTTSMLLRFLNGVSAGGDEAMLGLFNNAGVITVNIGGNNILQPFLDSLPGPGDMIKMIIEVRDFISENRELVAEAMEIAGEARDLAENFNIFDILRLNAFIRKAVPVLDDAADALNQIGGLGIVRFMSLLMGSLPPELEAGLQKGVGDFEAEFLEIIKWLETNAPDAVIIVNTVYNPIPREILDMPVEISNRADELIRAMNYYIIKESETGRYLVSDVYSRFEDEPDILEILNFEFDFFAMILNFDIIHPNAAGHELIAGLNHGALISGMIIIQE